MGVTPAYNYYQDALAKRKKQALIKGLVLSVAIGIALAGVVAYFLFYTSYFNVTNFTINGLKTIDRKDIDPTMNEILEKNIFNLFRNEIKQRENILFFDTDLLKDELLSRFPVIKSLDINKEYFHAVILNFTERVPIGIWCFKDNCLYFDDEGVLWGKTLKSTGPLLLSVYDFRSGQDTNKADSVFLSSIISAADGLENINININRSEIPLNSIGDFRIYTQRGFYILFNTESDIKEQVNILRIFLADQGEEFDPLYIDLRIGGRIYYKENS